MNIKKWIPLLCLIVAFYIIYTNKFASQYSNKNAQIQFSTNKEINENIQNNQRDTFDGIENDIEIPVNYPISLSYKTKQEIYSIRNNYVQKSIFAKNNYKPSEEVFGMIEDGKPWMSVNICRRKTDNLADINGASEEARFINNPTMLVAIEYPFLWNNNTKSAFCNNEDNKLIPQKIYFSKNKREITVEYSILPFQSNKQFFYTFNGLNARDLGYKYAYLDLSQSDTNIEFLNPLDNISNKVIEFTDFIHLGSSCGHDGGCNNGSPRQPYLEFYIQNYKSTAGVIYIKLWKVKPLSVKQAPDLVEKIVIDI